MTDKIQVSVPSLPSADKTDTSGERKLYHPRIHCEKHSFKVDIFGSQKKARRDPLAYKGFCADCLFEAARDGHTTMDAVAEATLKRRQEVQAG